MRLDEEGATLMGQAPPAVTTKRAIRRHYDLATPFYRLLWGVHIHHGLWDADESPARAQRRLIEDLAAAADVPPGAAVLDVGCGLGGSALYLARHRGCRVLGLTLSPVQRAWASLLAGLGQLRRQVRFVCRDAERVHFPAAAFDVIWSIECTEHLFDKPAFFRKAAGWLRPGGRVAVCAWLAGDRPHDPTVARQIEAVCRGFLCPSLGTADDYQTWLHGAGLAGVQFADLTERVSRTWEICRRRVERAAVRPWARLAGRDMVGFLDHFDTILAAYRSGAMRYGRFVAQKG
jgi:tocopherol O-methyltransferase